MFEITKISKNLIGVSLISVMMVFWLGSGYLSDAHTQFTGATQLQRSLVPESTLFELARSLDRERAAVQQQMVSSDVYDDTVRYLDGLTLKSRKLFDQARKEILLTKAENSGGAQYRFSDESLQKVIEELDDKFGRMSMSRTLLIGQSYLPLAERDESVRMQMYDAYVEFIGLVNNLRKRTHALPERNYIEVLAAHEIKNSIWVLNDSLSQTNTLLESFILKYQNSSTDSVSVDQLALRIFQQHEKIDDALRALAELVQEKSIAGITSESVQDLELHYQDVFRPMVKNLILTSPRDYDSAQVLAQWQKVAVEYREQVHHLEYVALANTISIANSIKVSATTKLILDTLTVLLCFIMALAAFRIAKKVQYQAEHDSLTGVPNRRRFHAVLESFYKRVDLASEEKLVLMTLDLDGFKAVNDTMGHFAGDELLKQVAQRLGKELDDDKILARMGGDEFSIAFVTRDSEAAYWLAIQLRDSFDTSFEVEDGIVKIDTSIGYSTYPGDAANLKDLLITSDFAMFSAKQSGRKTIQPYDKEVAKQFEFRNAIEKDLVNAIESNELELFYQPQFNLSMSKANAVEALIRWNHPTRGFISPLDFIGVAEETGLMPLLGNWVLNEACRQAAVWNNSENLSIRVAVNISVHQIMQNDFLQSVF
ncbi:MAG: diguanylate cyclase, partial [Gammaproteobacteria bacterium]|nr:diguanylate cyclase [Gammaproteobacteria bacterium]